MLRASTLLSLLFLSGLCHGQEWTVFSTENSGIPSDTVLRIEIDDQDRVWLGTLNGIGVFNGDEWELYDGSNSALPSDSALVLDIDRDGNKWISTPKGVVRTNGKKWELYDTSNSRLPSNHVKAIEVDAKGITWMATLDSGLLKFDGKNWQIYDRSNFGLDNNSIATIFIDPEGAMILGMNRSGCLSCAPIIQFYTDRWVRDSDMRHPWFTVEDITMDSTGSLWCAFSSVGPHGSGGVLEFDGAEWVTHKTVSYSPDLSTKKRSESLPGIVTSIAVDSSNGKWFGTRHGGIVHFTEGEWTVFNSSNSGLPHDYVYDLAFDEQGKLWIGTMGGLAVFGD